MRKAEQKNIHQWVLDGATIATMAGGKTPYGLVEQAALAMDGERIAWVGAATELPVSYAGWHRKTLPGGLITPALIDCHTHIIYGGDRASEWEMRLLGTSYEDISRAGGGIRSTVAATRAASEDELVTSARRRLDDLIAEGLGTIEIKSGYGLDTQNECKMLRAARALGRDSGVRVRTSFLGAHALPAEYEGRSDAYIDLVVEEMLPAVAEQNLADYCDGFCENIAFSVSQMRTVLEKAKSLGLSLRLHAEQLSNQHGAQMAAELGALSCDHLEYVDEAGVKAMADAGTTAVLLPGAFYFLGESKKPPIAMLRDHGVSMALASDCNPGSSPLTSLLLTMNMGCTLFGLTPEEALAGTTRAAAAALGLGAHLGTLEVGKTADFAYWDVDHPGHLAYPLGANPHRGQIRTGQWVT
ncbi:MAG: imidazolonepropionase [Robiginitomaculum sp.]|nr:MAG: imidazolonepropionase [Robiginitomaculum sp.]